MAPIREFSTWNERSSDSNEQIEPYKRYYFMCEGKNTEWWYFNQLISRRKTLSIHSQIDLIYLEKIDEHKNISNPKSLINFAHEQVEKEEIEFDKDHDKMVIIFDVDIFESQQNNYDEILGMCKEYDIFGITNPSFELFLLLHYENSIEEIIEPNAIDIIQNAWIALNENEKVRCIEKTFYDKTGLRPKKDEAIGLLAKKVLVAIQQEKKLNNDIYECKGKITSNIGLVIESIINDQCND